jgi:hypothetical protein
MDGYMDAIEMATRLKRPEPGWRPLPGVLKSGAGIFQS